MAKIKATILTFVFGLIITTVASNGNAGVTPNPRDAFVAKADIIVEGTVVHRLDAADRKVQGHVGPSETTVLFQFGISQKSFFKISKVYKGAPTENQIIAIYAYPEVTKDVTELVLDKKYLLFLKRLIQCD